MRPPRSRQPPIFRDERRKDTFRQKPWCSSDVLSATQRTATSGKNNWAILRGTGIPESIRAIGVSYSLVDPATVAVLLAPAPAQVARIVKNSSPGRSQPLEEAGVHAGPRRARARFRPRGIHLPLRWWRAG